MLLSFAVVATFGVSALLSFTVFSTILLLIAAKKGLLQAKKSRKESALSNQILSEKLLRQQNLPMPTAPELTPHASRHLLGPQN